VNVGEYLATFGGGGHRGAGTAQLAKAKAGEQIQEILGHLKANR
jgi:nanoRNase/pAp phosphatase (c-di-AMP/oligoRNAs hydrolase)